MSARLLERADGAQPFSPDGSAALSSGNAMSRLSNRFAKALSEGRTLRWRPENREQILARLLVKRAEAKQAGLNELESSLRQQIRWSLPMHRLEDEPGED